MYFVTGEEGGGGLSQPLSTHSFSALASLLYAAFSSFTCPQTVSLRASPGPIRHGKLFGLLSSAGIRFTYISYLRFSILAAIDAHF